MLQIPPLSPSRPSIKSMTSVQATINSIKYILGADSKKIFSFSISDEVLKELKLVSDLYFNEKLEKEYKMEILS